MAVAPIFFEPERAIELVLYVVSRSRRPTFRSVSRIFYFADREHLSRYGSLSFSQLTAKSHDTAWTSADKNEIIDVRAIAKTLRNAKDVLAYSASRQL